MVSTMDQIESVTLMQLGIFEDKLMFILGFLQFSYMPIIACCLYIYREFSVTVSYLFVMVPRLKITEKWNTVFILNPFYLSTPPLGR